MAQIQYRIKMYNSGEWDLVSKDLLDVEQKAFPRGRFDAEQMRRLFENPNNTVSLIQYRSVGKKMVTKKVVGYALVKPSKKPKQARLFSIAIAPAHQGKGLLKRVISTLDKKLKEQNYHKLKMEARMKNQFNEKIKQTYRKRIETIERPINTNIGLLEPIVLRIQ